MTFPFGFQIDDEKCLEFIVYLSAFYLIIIVCKKKENTGIDLLVEEI